MGQLTPDQWDLLNTISIVAFLASWLLSMVSLFSHDRKKIITCALIFCAITTFVIYLGRKSASVHGKYYSLPRDSALHYLRREEVRSLRESHPREAYSIDLTTLEIVSLVKEIRSRQADVIDASLQKEALSKAEGCLRLIDKSGLIPSVIKESFQSSFSVPKIVMEKATCEKMFPVPEGAAKLTLEQYRLRQEGKY